MARTATIHARVDAETKSKAKRVLGALNISISEAISVYLKQIIYHKGIPFELKIPNEITAKTLEDSQAGRELHKVAGVDELFRELDS